MSTDSGSTWSKMSGFPSIASDGVRISVSMAAPTAIYAFFGFNGVSTQQLWACSPVGPGCTFIALTNPSFVLTQAPPNIVAFADPNNATRAYIGGFKPYFRVDNVDFNSGSATYTCISGSGCTSDGSSQHADGRVMIMDANGDLLEGKLPRSYNTQLLNSASCFRR